MQILLLPVVQKLIIISVIISKDTLTQGNLKMCFICFTNVWKFVGIIHLKGGIYTAIIVSTLYSVVLQGSDRGSLVAFQARKYDFINVMCQKHLNNAITNNSREFFHNTTLSWPVQWFCILIGREVIMCFTAPCYKPTAVKIPYGHFSGHLLFCRSEYTLRYFCNIVSHVIRDWWWHLRY